MSAPPLKPALPGVKVGQAGGPKPDADEIKRAVRVLYGELSLDRVAELRSLNSPWSSFKDVVNTCGGWFSDADSFVRCAVELNTNRGGATAYATLNEINPDLLAKCMNQLRKKHRPATADTDVIRRHWLVVDSDVQRLSQTSATDDEKLAAFNRGRAVMAHLRSLGWPEPVEADSGNGHHALYRIDEPADDGGLVERCLKALDAQFGDDVVKIDSTVATTARIMKVYGTVAMKGSHHPRRPHRLSRILSEPVEGQPYGGAQVVPTELLEQLAGELPEDAPKAEAKSKTKTKTKPAAAKPEKRTSQEAEPTGWLPGWIARHELDVGRPRRWSKGGWKWIFNTCPFCGESDDSAVILYFASQAAQFKCQHNRCKDKDWHSLKAKLGLDTESLNRSQKEVRGALTAHELNHPAGWRWVGAAASRAEVLELARGVCPAEFRPDFDQGVQDHEAGRTQPKLHPDEKVRKQVSRAVKRLTAKEGKERPDEDPLAGVEIVELVHRKRARGAGGTFDLWIKFEGVTEQVSGLQGKDLRSYSTIHARALESGLMLPHVPSSVGPNVIWGELLSPVFRDRRRVVNLPEIGELGVAIEEALVGLVAGGDRGETADELTDGHLVLVDRNDRVIPVGEPTAEGYYLVATNHAHKHVKAELPDDAPKRDAIAAAVLALGGSYRGGAGGKGFVFPDGRERAVYALPVSLANPQAWSQIPA